MFSWLKKTLTGRTKSRQSPAKSAHGEINVNVTMNAQDAFNDSLRQGGIAVSQGNLAAAAEYFGLAVAKQPENVLARIALASSLVDQALYLEAKPHLNRAILLDASNADAYYLLGGIHLETGKHAQAIEHFEEALSLKPDFELALRDLSRALFESGRKDRVRALISQGIRQFPASVDFHYYQANLYLDDRRYIDAIEWYGKALAMRPDYAEVHNNLSQAWLELGSVDDAIVSARRALDLRPNYIAAHDNLLWAMLFVADDSRDEYLVEAAKYGAMVRQMATPYTRWQGRVDVNLSATNRSRLRVGFVSGDFRVHAVGYLLEGLLPKLSLMNLELVAYSMNPRDDWLTERIKTNFTRWTPIAGMSDEQAARQIHADGVDVLIDLAGHDIFEFFFSKMFFCSGQICFWNRCFLLFVAWCCSLVAYFALQMLIF